MSSGWQWHVGDSNYFCLLRPTRRRELQGLAILFYNSRWNYSPGNTTRVPLWTALYGFNQLQVFFEFFFILKHIRSTRVACISKGDTLPSSHFIFSSSASYERGRYRTQYNHLLGQALLLSAHRAIWLATLLDAWCRFTSQRRDVYLNGDSNDALLERGQ